jgi:hypothetical protein
MTMQCIYVDTNFEPVSIGDKFKWETTDMTVVGFEDSLVLMQDDAGATYGFNPAAIGATWANA